MNGKQELSLNDIVVGRHFYVNYCTQENGRYIIHVLPARNKCKCPQCGRESSTIASSYKRTIQDIPLENKPTYQVVLIHRYRCLNPSCPRKIFSERLTIADSRQVRSRNLNFMILNFSIFLSDLESSRLFLNIGVDVSHDTIQRLYNNINYYDDPNVKDVGIDDVSIKKGLHYITVIYDLKDHHLLALLKGRDGTALKPWLERHKKIEVVARDRDSSFAKVISKVLPNCNQVADRFHLIHDMVEYLDKKIRTKLPMNFFIKNGKLLDKIPRKVRLEDKLTISADDLKLIQTLRYNNELPLDSNGKIITFDRKWRNSTSLREHRRLAKRLARKKLVKEIRSEYDSGKLTLVEISKIYNLPLRTLKRFLAMTSKEVEELDIPHSRYKRKTVIDDYINIIFKMMKDGYSDQVIFAYVISKGYEHNYETLWSYIYNMSKNNFPSRHTTSSKYRFGKRIYPKDVIVINRGKLLRSIFEDKSDNEYNSSFSDLIRSKYSTVDEVAQIYDDYHKAIMGTDVTSIDKFINKYDGSIVAGFCKHLKKDIVAIHRSISSSISSGFVEGNNTKLKLMEQIVFHKGTIINFYKKCYLAFMTTVSNFDLKEIYI